MVLQVPLMRLECGCNSYEWGKFGHTSAAAKFASATNFKIQEEKPYAELWMGTHPSLPSKDFETQRSLVDIVQENQALLGSDIAKRYNHKLPFLFKVLSIGKALSIQAHPNKKLAEELHAKDPKNYPDDNHKPEMTIAVTPFTGLCGFRPLAEIRHFINSIPPLHDLIGQSAIDAFESTTTSHETECTPENRSALSTLFTALMENGSDKSRLGPLAKKLVELAASQGSKFAEDGGPSPHSGSDLAELIQVLDSQFPGDIGLFLVFFLNYVELHPGEAMFLKADDIHAYLSGDIIECMASSDNVVRAGFTPKFKDVKTLTGMLTYDFAPISEQKMDPVDYPYVKLDKTAYSSGSSATLYDPPIEEFSVVRTVLKGDGAKATFEAIEGPSIIICTGGEGTISVGPKTEEVKTGYVYFVGATAELVLESKSEDFTSFKAFAELKGKETAGQNANGSSNGA